MLAYIAWDGDHIGRQVGQAAIHNDVDGLRQLSQHIDRGNNIWRSWVELIGGSVISIGGDEGRVEIPADKLAEIPKLREQYQGAVGSTVSVGVGMKLNEAEKALIAAKLQGGDKIYFYSANIDKIIEESKSRQDPEAVKEDQAYFGKAETTEEEEKLRRTHYNPKRFGMEDAEKYQVKKLHELFGVEIWGVNGKEIRNNEDIDFTSDANDARHSYVPLGRIYLDEVLEPLDKLATGLHAFIERHKMIDEGWSYDKAHDFSSDEEIKFREANKDVTTLDWSLVEAWLKKYHDAENIPLTKAIPGMNEGANAGFGGAHKPNNTAKPSKPVASQGEHSEAQNVYNLIDEERPAPPEKTHAAKDLEEQFHMFAQEQQEPDEDPQLHQNLQQVKEHVVAILQQVKQQAPVLEQLKQQAPDVYKTIIGVVQAMIELGKEVIPTVQKSEADFEPLSKTTLSVQKVNYPQKANSDYLFRLMSQIHRGSRKDLNRIPMEGNWELQDVDINKLPSIYQPDEPQVREYVKMPAETRPPIIIHNDKLIDGYHRVSSAKARGDKSLLAYVPIEKEELNPDLKPSVGPVLDKDMEKSALPMPKAPTREEHTQPVGAQLDSSGKIKVIHPDGSSSWKEVRAGQMMSQICPTQHPVSTREPSSS